MSSKIDIPNFNILPTKLMRQAQRIVGTEAVKFFKDSFRKGGFTDTSFVAWKETSNPLSGKKTMYGGGGGGGTLMGSIRKVQKDFNLGRVVIESDSKYAEIHNKGGYITVTPRMKNFFWWKYKCTQKIEKKRLKNGKYANTARNRKIDAKAEFFKRMALMKVGSRIKIPQRQFMGESKAMMHQIEKEYIDRIVEEWKKITPF